MSTLIFLFHLCCITFRSVCQCFIKRMCIYFLQVFYKCIFLGFNKCYFIITLFFRKSFLIIIGGDLQIRFICWHVIFFFIWAIIIFKFSLWILIWIYNNLDLEFIFLLLRYLIILWIWFLHIVLYYLVSVHVLYYYWIVI